MKKMASYSDDQKKEFIDLAADIGINRARRELGYPSNWIVGKKWLDDAGVVIPLDELKQRGSQYNQFYSDSELLLALQDSIERAMELMADPKLSPVELEKLTTAIKKASDSIREIQGKTAKNESSTDKNIEELLNKFDGKETKAVND